MRHTTTCLYITIIDNPSPIRGDDYKFGTGYNGKKIPWLILKCKPGTCLITKTEDKSSRTLAWYSNNELTDVGRSTVQLNLFCTTHVHIASGYPLFTLSFCAKTYIYNYTNHLHSVTSNLHLSTAAVEGDLLNQLLCQSGMSRIHNVLSICCNKTQNAKFSFSMP